MLELVAGVEVILDGALTTTGHEPDIGQPRFQRFLHRVLHQRLVQDGKNLLGHRLGRRQKTRAVAGNGKQTLPDHEIHLKSSAQGDDGRPVSVHYQGQTAQIEQ